MGGAEVGGRPSNLRWPGVRGISDRSSLGLNRGRRFVPMLKRGMARTVQYAYRE